MKLSTDSMTPLYIQLENIIAEYVKDGTLAPGNRVPMKHPDCQTVLLPSQEDLTDASLYGVLNKHGITLVSSAKTLEIVFASYKNLNF